MSDKEYKKAQRQLAWAYKMEKFGKYLRREFRMFIRIFPYALIFVIIVYCILIKK